MQWSCTATVAGKMIARVPLYGANLLEIIYNNLLVTSMCVRILLVYMHVM